MAARSQSLLHQGIGRTQSGHALNRLLSGLSPFFIRASAGRRTGRAMRPQIRLSPFFIRASAGRRLPNRQHARIRLSPFFIRASAGRSLRWIRAATVESQSLLHQGIGRTSCDSRAIGSDSSLSPFFIRASAGPDCSQADAQAADVSVPSSSGHRPDRYVSRYSRVQLRSQSLLHQGIGRTGLPVPTRPSC